MKKIVFANDVMYGYASRAPWATGGAERYQWLLARALAASGWSVKVGVREALSSGSRETIDGVEFVGIGRQQILSCWYQFLKSERPGWWFWATASHWWGPAVEVAKLVGVRTIFSSQFDTDVMPRHALFERRRWWPLYGWGLLRSDKIFVQHAGQLSRLSDALKSKASVLPGIVMQNGSYTPHSSRGGYVAWVGMIRQPKRPDRLLEIARLMPEVRFVVCGGSTPHRNPEGYSERMIEELRRLPNLEYLGLVPPDKSLDIIARADVLLSTSDGEGFPSVFLEAWSSGTPVVSLEIDPDQIIARQELGRVSGTVEKAALDLKTLINSIQERERIAARARRYIADHHSNNAVVSVFERNLPSL